MAITYRNSLKLLLKLVNAVFGALGLFLVMFGFWVLRVWQREVADGSISSSYPLPWFVYASVGLGAGLCLITCIGHTAADTANPSCLSFYLVIIFVLMAMEVAFAADVYMNSDWEKDLPEDQSGMVDDIADYIESNSERFRWVGLSVVSAQVFCVLLVILLRNVGAEYELDEDDYVAPRLPMLHHQYKNYPVQDVSLFYGAEPSFAGKDDGWKIQSQARCSEAAS